MKFLRYLLFPVSVLYAFISKARNYLFDKQILLHSVRPLVPSICVGNLTVGGTGKTPHVEFLIEALKGEFDITTLSRGYGRKTKGYILADENVTAEKIGDEPFQIYDKYKNNINVCVGEDRVSAFDRIVKDVPETSLVILDDAYQHRYVKASCNVLLTDYNRLFFDDVMLPTGNLREVRSGADRADIIIVTKCDEAISVNEQSEISNGIRKYNMNAIIYFSYISYNKVIIINELNEYVNCVSVSGIAQNDMFHVFCNKEFSTQKSFSFRDHKSYTLGDFESIVSYCKLHKATMLVTEKDYVKLQSQELRKFLSQISWGYVPIKVNFVTTNQTSFIDEIKRYI